MKKKQLITVLLFSMMITSCAKSELGSPCPNYGAFCRKQPINSWDYHH